MEAPRIEEVLPVIAAGFVQHALKILGEDVIDISFALDFVAFGWSEDETVCVIEPDVFWNCQIDLFHASSPYSPNMLPGLLA